MAALVVLCPADGHAQSRRPRGCVEPKPIVTPARIGSKNFLYVEQETVTPQSDGRVLVAGNPVFLWGRLGKIWDVLPQDTLMGMIVSPPARVLALRSPIPGRPFSGVRSAALPDGWWLVTFAEVVAASAPVAPRVISYWSAETDGMVWRSLQQLPSVSDSLNASESSALVLRDGRAMLAVPAWRAGQHRVVLFVRERGAWSATNAYVGRYSYVALAATASRDVLAVVGPDSTEREDNNSLFIFRKSPSDTGGHEATVSFVASAVLFAIRCSATMARDSSSPGGSPRRTTGRGSPGSPG